MGGSTATVLVSSRHSVQRVEGEAHLFLLSELSLHTGNYPLGSWKCLEKKKREVEGTEILEQAVDRAQLEGLGIVFY